MGGLASLGHPWAGDSSGHGTDHVYVGDQDERPIFVTHKPVNVFMFDSADP